VLRLISTFFLLISICFAQEQPEPASLEGKVTNLIGGQAVRKVNLTLRPMGAASGEPAKPYGTVSDSDGKFIFEAVEPGRYTLYAERAGFVRQSYGARHSGSAGTVLALAAGQHLKDIAFQLTPQAVLSGKVVDDEGDPVGRTQIRVLQMGYRNGKRQAMARQGGMSDEEGEFKISALSPGRYYLCASAPMRMMAHEGTRSAARDPSKANAPREEFAETCYPSATDSTGAVPIDVAAGQSVAGIDIRLRKSAVVRVKGQVAGNIPSRPYDQIQISLQSMDPANSMFSFGGSGNVDKKGNFELLNVHAGSYRLTAISFQGVPQTLGSQPIEVGNEDIKDITIRLIPPTDLPGRVIVEGQAPQPAPAMQIQFYTSDTISFGSSDTSVGDDGTFTLNSVTPAKYSLSIHPLPDGAYLRTIRIGDQEMPANAIDLSGGVSGQLQVYLKMSAGEIDGVVHDDDGQPAGGAVVTVAPDPPNPEQEQLYHRSETDQNGTFQVKNVAPGNYRVYAWEDLEYGAQLDPDLLKAHSSRSERVTIDESGKAQVTLARISVTSVEEAKAKAGK
jgi:protocatechuate 3,4-dioxygenase beta subunit